MKKRSPFPHCNSCSGLGIVEMISSTILLSQTLALVDQTMIDMFQRSQNCHSTKYLLATEHPVPPNKTNGLVLGSLPINSQSGGLCEGETFHLGGLVDTRGTRGASASFVTTNEPRRKPGLSGVHVFWTIPPFSVINRSVYFRTSLHLALVRALAAVI
jgi:hypothetical protein